MDTITINNARRQARECEHEPMSKNEHIWNILMTRTKYFLNILMSRRNDMENILPRVHG
jgi:hypothetical protein